MQMKSSATNIVADAQVPRQVLLHLRVQWGSTLPKLTKQLVLDVRTLSIPHGRKQLQQP